MYDNIKTNILKQNIVNEKIDDNMKTELNDGNINNYYLQENKKNYNIP